MKASAPFGVVVFTPDTSMGDEPVDLANLLMLAWNPSLANLIPGLEKPPEFDLVMVPDREGVPSELESSWFERYPGCHCVLQYGKLESITDEGRASHWIAMATFWEAEGAVASLAGESMTLLGAPD